MAGTDGWLALINGSIMTMDEREPEAQAVLAHGESIVMIGQNDTVKAEAPAGATVVDLAGRTVTPGLIDSHLHLFRYGETLAQVDLGGTRTLDDFLQRLARDVAARPAGAWVSGRGWDQDRLAERRYPTRHDLDRVTAEHPVLLIRVCGHAAVANSMALRMAGVNAATADPPGGQIDRDPQTGEPTGVLRERATDLVRRHIPEDDFATRKQALKGGIERALAAGLTGVHSQDVWEEGDFDQIRRLYGTLRREGTALRVFELVGVNDMASVRAEGLRTGDGDPYFKVGPIKVFADGSLGASTAALIDPYSDGDQSGLLIYPEEQLTALIAEAHDAGFQVAVHAIGDRGAELTLAGFARAQQRHRRCDPRHRLVHCQIMQPEQWARMREPGVIGDIQPKFVTSDLHWTDDRVGPQRARHAYAWRSLLAAGVHAAGGSDAPVEPIEPMQGIYAAVTRSDLDGCPAGGWHPEQCLAVTAALHLFTRGAAYAAFEEDHKGMVAPGYLADLVVWPQDPRRLPPADLKDLRPDLTILGGRIAYRRTGG
ncbi:MAG: amidohydrolase [Thermaerobacterales bacterium]